METTPGGYSLILETSFTGHRAEYVRHIMRFIISERTLHRKYTFLLNEQMQNLIGDLRQSDVYEIRYISFKNKYSNSIQNSFADWKLISEVLKLENRYTEIIFLDIDTYLILLTTRQFKKFNFSVKGILFEPYTHLKERKGNFWFLVRHYLKSYFLQKFSVLFNSDIQKIFILSDKKCIPLMNKKIKNIFYYLPDPINNESVSIDLNQASAVLNKFAVKQSKKVLLLFGQIDSRKNLINIINAVAMLPTSLKQQVHLLIAGKFNDLVKEKYITHINKYKSEISISYRDAFVTDEEREILFQHCSIVVMPYVNFYSSSGILGHAIKYSKNVIASKEGIVGRIVKEQNMGIAVDPKNPLEIKNAVMEILLTQRSFHYDNAQILHECSAHNFSKNLLAV